MPEHGSCRRLMAWWPWRRRRRSSSFFCCRRWTHWRRIPRQRRSPWWRCWNRGTSFSGNTSTSTSARSAPTFWADQSAVSDLADQTISPRLTLHLRHSLRRCVMPSCWQSRTSSRWSCWWWRHFPCGRRAWRRWRHHFHLHWLRWRWWCPMLMRRRVAWRRQRWLCHIWRQAAPDR